MKTTVRRSIWAVALALPGLLSAQPIHLSLHPTATPDSFQVRATSAQGVLTSLPNAVLTLRWEVASGGVANNADVRRGCGAYTILNYGGSVDIGPYRYFTLVLMGDRHMEQAGCAIGPEGFGIAGVRIRQMSGCRNVSLVQNGYTGMNNLDYYFSMGGVDVTGNITTAPIPAGDCSGCEPPAIQAMQVGGLPFCGSGPLNFSVTATGSDLDYSWFGPNGVAVGYTASGTAPQATTGWYTVTVANSCGSVSQSGASGFDPQACVPPNISAALFEPQQPDGVTMRLRTQAIGSCLSYRWILPNGSIQNSTNAYTSIIPSTPGVYTFIATGACGADTVVRTFTEDMTCLKPVLSLISSTAPVPLCGPEPFTLQAQATGLPTPVLSWVAPNGALLGTGNSVLVDPPTDGLYVVRAESSCGLDSMVHQVHLDTAGSANCIPPVIHGITGQPICAGDTLRLQADVSLDGPCADIHWRRGTGSWRRNGPHLNEWWSFPGPVTLHVSNACGADSLSYLPPVTYMQYMYSSTCDRTATLSLDSAYAHGLEPGGHWEFNGETVTGIVEPLVGADTLRCYFYRAGSGCLKVRYCIQDWVVYNAGEDALVQICDDQESFSMFPYLGPDADDGGKWWYGLWDFPNGIYVPSLHFFPGPMTISYYVGPTNSPCRDTAYVTVQKMGPAVPWYADADGDSLGNPLDSILACIPTPGYVENADDACPLVFGTVGDPCDDGNALTINDSLNVDCQCVGLSTVGLHETSGQGWLLWPNPASEILRLQGPAHTGRVDLQLVDAGGRVVRTWSRTLHASAVELPVHGLAPGSYALRIVGHEAVQVLRVVLR